MIRTPCWPLMAALLLGAVLVGCGQRRGLLEPDARVTAEVRRYGVDEAVARTELQAAQRNSAPAYTRLAQTCAIKAAGSPGEEERRWGRRASDALDKAVRLDPRYAPATVQKANLLLEAEQNEAAAKLMRDLLAAGGRVPEAYALLARALVVQNRAAEAEQLLRQGLGTYPRDHTLHWALAVALNQLGQADQADASFNRAVRLRPREPALRLAYAEFLRGREQHAAAVAQSLEAVRLKPDSVEARFVAGTDLYVAGQRDAAIAQFREALVIEPRQPWCANNLALVLADEQLDTTTAVSWARAAVRAAPDDPKLAETLGWALARDGQYADALRILRGLHRRWPEVAAINYHLGWTLVRTGSRAEGLGLLRRAAAGDDADIARLSRKALQELSR